jgi:CYTH domain-containing protein
MLEIERKWRLRFVPGELHGHSTLIEQGYILTGDPEVRLRRQDGDLLITVKGEGDIERTEWDSPLPPWVFESLWTRVTCSLRKLRMTLGYKSYEHVLEIDTYLDTLDGLIILECEFKSIEAADAFELPTWATGSMEVTYDPRYKNKNLAQLTSLNELGPF